LTAGHLAAWLPSANPRGTFARLQRHARTTPLPAWFRPYTEIEAAATQLRMFEHAIIPGLLQTEDYARAILSVRPSTTADELEELVAARMDRQAVLRRPRPPLVWVVIDESALHRQVGFCSVLRVSHEQGVRGLVPLLAALYAGC
jgi:hypothetical protein